MTRYDYGGLYKLYDMNGIIEAGTGLLKVHDIFDETPEFMKQADFVFCDPPYNQGALSSFYTKAGIDEKPKMDEFTARLFEVIDDINPNAVVLESSVKFSEDCRELLAEHFSVVKVYSSMYYHNKNNPCCLLAASNSPEYIDFDEIDGMDEEDAISYICKNAKYDCIADPCIGRGLVAYYANLNGRKFVGTELNPKRLAVAIDRVLKS